VEGYRAFPTLVKHTMASEFKRQFGLRVRRLREASGLSQEQLAAAARLHATHISLIERGQRSARLETIERLALALRCQPARLMPPIRMR
jgi:transcriptional regulator with XRE-family HTH domain